MADKEWRTLSDGRRIQVSGASSKGSLVKRFERGWEGFTESKRKVDPALGLVECFWCPEIVYFVRAENGGCFLSDAIPPPNWEVHSCWAKRQHLNSIADKLTEHYQALGVKPVLEKQKLSRHGDGKNEPTGGTYREDLSDVTVAVDIQAVHKCVLHSIYELEVMLDDKRFSIVRLSAGGSLFSCLVLRTLLESGVLKKRATYTFEISSFQYGKRKLLHISKIIKPNSIVVAIENNVEVITVVGNPR